MDKINSEEWAKNNDDYNNLNKNYYNLKKENGKPSKKYKDIILDNNKLKSDYDGIVASYDHVVKENEKFKRRIKDLDSIIKIYKNNGKDKVDNDYKSLEEKYNKLIKDFNNLKNEYNNLKESEKKIISVIFSSTNQNIHYSLPLKTTDVFGNLEKLLYEEFPHYKNENHVFTVNGGVIDRNRTLSENKISNSNVIMIN